MALDGDRPAEDRAFFPEPTLRLAGAALDGARRLGIRIAAAETVTAGLVSACLTSVPGASQVFDRAIVLYHESAKATGLGVPPEVSARHGAVSAEVTRGLAEGLLDHSGADATIAVTGYAGPGGGTAENPVGTIYLASARRDRPTLAERHVFSGSRDGVRLQAIDAAIRLLSRQLDL